MLNVLILFKYCLLLFYCCWLKWHFSDTVCNTVRVLLYCCSKILTDILLLLLVNCVIFGFLFCTVQIQFHHCWDRVENYCFFEVSINMQNVVCNMYCREFEAAACNAPPSSTMTRDFALDQSDSDNGRNQAAAFFPQQHQFSLLTIS